MKKCLLTYPGFSIGRNANFLQSVFLGWISMPFWMLYEANEEMGQSFKDLYKLLLGLIAVTAQITIKILSFLFARAIMLIAGSIGRLKCDD